ncbi:MAG: cyclic nucleotide-binding domain-containing protein [Lachnospiraceae bacterium]|nr:cyclic nucleotide-binding domain-containing protein [Lachnospiraceae bacterium]
MIVVQDKKLLQRYCEKYDICSHFSNWEALTKKLVRYRKGELIALYGDKADKLFFLISGTVKFSCIADNYEEYFFFDARNEGLFGEVEYVMDIPLISQSEVTEDCECIVIPIEENRHILDNDLKFQIFLTNILAQKYNDMRRRYMDIEAYPLEIRFVKYLLSDREGDDIGSLRQISGAIRCSYRQLLRVVKRFCERGWIEHLEQKGKYRITDREALERMLGEMEI